MKKQVKIVVGANYGDECKGLATAYFSEEHKNDNCLNILFNGSCQRGHTVDLNDRERHIFHHFGSGSFSNASTYFDQNFIINPIFFVEEYCDLQDLGIAPKCYCSPNCRVAVPYDAIINQIIERSRGKDKHGSCGVGVWETVERYRNSEFNLTVGELRELSDEELRKYLKDIATKYVPDRLQFYCKSNITDIYSTDILALTECDGLIEHYIKDFRLMCQLNPFATYPALFDTFDSFIFEGAQGLALDKDNTAFYPYLTPSSTTSEVPLDRIKKFGRNVDVEVCYITRSYFTRHGAGPFPSECDKSDICSDIEDFTNLPNSFQEFIRYGKFKKDEFISRVSSDMHHAKSIFDDIRFSLFVSHLNYTNNELAGDCTLKELSNYFDRVYISSAKYASSVEVIK